MKCRRTGSTLSVRIYFEPEETRLTKNQFRALSRKLKQGGFGSEFVRRYVLPEWWDDECHKDPTLTSELEFRVARFLGVPIATVRDPDAVLGPTQGKGAQLRRVKGVELESLAPAIHAGIRIAEAVIRTSSSSLAAFQPPPMDPIAWRDLLLSSYGEVSMKSIASDLWTRGIPIIYASSLPTPKYQGMACIVLGRPAIVIGHLRDEPSRLAFFLAHEAAHIVNGDCTSGNPVVDANDDLPDDSASEHRADQFAQDLQLAAAPLDEVGEPQDGKSLARQASAFAKRWNVDAGSVIWSWASKTSKYREGNLALHALYLSRGGSRELQKLFTSKVDIGRASETDQVLLRGLLGSQSDVSAC